MKSGKITEQMTQERSGVEGGLKNDEWEKRKNIELISGQLCHPLKNHPKHIPDINCEIPEKCGCVVEPLSWLWLQLKGTV